MNPTVGEVLRQARQEKHISLEKASQALHIRQKYLEALEADQRDVLPSKVQAKGFVRMYAGYLGLPLQPLLDHWEGRVVPPPPPEKPTISPPDLPESEPPAEEAQPDVGVMEEYDEVEQPETEQASLPPSLQAFAEIGQSLFERRITLSLSLGDVERFTHVKQHYLKALEEGRLDDLPSTVQGRGMLNNYASFLDLDADFLLKRYAEGLQSRREERLTPATSNPKQGAILASLPKNEKKRTLPLNHWTRLITPDLILVGSVIIGLLIFAMWSTAQVTARQREAIQTTPLSIADVLLSATSQPKISTSTPTPGPNLGTRQPQTAAVTLASGGATLAITSSVPVTGSGALQLYVVAIQRTYLRVTADNRIIFDERLVPGNAYAFAGNRTLEVLIGNAAGVQLFFNQKDLGMLGVVGEVKRMLFTAEGIITPTLAFSATPTRTPIPSSTPRPSPTMPTPTITLLVP